METQKTVDEAPKFVGVSPRFAKRTLEGYTEVEYFLGVPRFTLWVCAYPRSSAVGGFLATASVRWDTEEIEICRESGTDLRSALDKLEHTLHAVFCGVCAFAEARRGQSASKWEELNE